MLGEMLELRNAEIEVMILPSKKLGQSILRKERPRWDEATLTYTNASTIRSYAVEKRNHMTALKTSKS